MDDIVKGSQVDSKFHSKVYSKGVKFNSSVLKVSNTRDNVAKAIKDIVEDIEKRNDSINVLKSIFAYIWEQEARSFDMKDIQVDSGDYYALTNYSKQKFLIKKLQEKYPNKQQRKKVLSDALTLQWWDSEMAESLKEIWLDPVLLNLAEIMSLNQAIEMQHLINSFVNEMDDPYQQTFINVLKSSWAPANVIKRFEEELGKQEEAQAIIHEWSTVDSQTISSLFQIETSQRKQTSDFNPMIYDLDLNLGLKLFNVNRLKEIYKSLFYKVVQDLSNDFWGKLPQFNELLLIQKNKFKGKVIQSKEEQEEKSIFQYIIEWEIDDSFSTKDLKEIVKMLNTEGTEFNLNSSVDSKAFNHPIKTSEWIQEYNGHFQNNGNGFLGESLIIIENKKTKQKTLRLTLNNFTQDLYTYFLSQISHYITHKIFINKQQLYFNIYDKYNKEIYGGNESYDISFFEKQYKSLMEKIIIPLSREGKDLQIKPHNTLLAWIYGSGKSQFLLKILREKKFILNQKEFNLNANVIYLDLQSFKGLLWAPIGGIRTKLDEIYQNTQTPILLVIEDIDTLVNEKMHGVNDEIAQAMTLFFEWIGSIPIHVVTTANEPSKLSERLIRPNRIYEIIEFYLPSIEEKKQILELHLKKNWIHISQEVKQNLINTKVFKEGTASHIAVFCDQILAKIKIQEALWNTNYSLSDDEIIQIAQNINISTKDINDTIERITKWVGSVTGNSAGLRNIWFIQPNS